MYAVEQFNMTAMKQWFKNIPLESVTEAQPSLNRKYKLPNLCAK